MANTNWQIINKLERRWTSDIISQCHVTNVDITSITWSFIPEGNKRGESPNLFDGCVSCVVCCAMCRATGANSAPRPFGCGCWFAWHGEVFIALKILRVRRNFCDATATRRRRYRLGCIGVWGTSPRTAIASISNLSCESNRACIVNSLRRLHRSHFGSRYKLGWCGNAGLFAEEQDPQYNMPVGHRYNELEVSYANVNFHIIIRRD